MNKKVKKSVLNAYDVILIVIIGLVLLSVVYSTVFIRVGEVSRREKISGVVVINAVSPDFTEMISVGDKIFLSSTGNLFATVSSVSSDGMSAPIKQEGMHTSALYPGKVNIIIGVSLNGVHEGDDYIVEGSVFRNGSVCEFATHSLSFSGTVTFNNTDK